MTDKQILKWLDQLQGELDSLKKKSGGGGGGTGGSITPLDTEAHMAWNTDYALADSIENYDLILIQMYFTGSESNWTGTRLFNVETFDQHNGIWIDGGSNDRALLISFTDNTHYRIVGGNQQNAIQGVFGIKL